MLDWTGERFLPWAKEAAVAYEHLHRYLWASNFVRDKRVLDLASGEGYGANILAAQASFVCGVDIDDPSVHHAAEKYRRPNLQFLQGDITRVPVEAQQSFDVIVCFEAIEHIEEHDRLMQEVVRLLKPEGLFIVSTPNKEVYRAAGTEEPNPFHVKELTFEEFDALLSARFSSVQYLGQRVHPGSTLWPIGMSDDASSQELAIARVDAEFRRIRGDQRIAEYFVAVASNGGAGALEGSVLMDHSDELLHEQRDAFQKKLHQRDEALTWRAGQVEVLEREKKDLLKGIDAARRESESLREELAVIHGSRSWKLLSKLRALRGKLGV
jgi:O-antigen biosynthesis protein